MSSDLTPIDSPPSVAPTPGGCIYRWVGPGTGWVLVFDDCHGHCKAPTGDGDYVDQEVTVTCDLA